jgi:hypothetical protein
MTVYTEFLTVPDEELTKARSKMGMAAPGAPAAPAQAAPALADTAKKK